MHAEFRVKLEQALTVQAIRQRFNVGKRKHGVVACVYDLIEGVFLEDPSGRVRLVPLTNTDWILHILGRPCASILEFLAELQIRHEDENHQWIRAKNSLRKYFSHEANSTEYESDPLPCAVDLSPAQQNAVNAIERYCRRRRWVPLDRIRCRDDTAKVLARAGIVELDTQRWRVRLTKSAF